MNREDLYLLIHEEIYVVEKEGSAVSEEPSIKAEADTKIPAPSSEPDAVANHAPDTVPSVSKTPTATSPQSSISFAIFHDAEAQEELELLGKIIDACELPNGSYEVFANGFNKEVKFEKALVFVATAKKFYVPIPYENSQILCSKPLHEIANDKQEKVKLWGALKNFT